MSLGGRVWTFLFQQQVSWWFEEGKVRVASSKEVAALNLGKEQQGENYENKRTLSLDLGVPPSYTLRTPLPQCRN